MKFARSLLILVATISATTTASDWIVPEVYTPYSFLAVDQVLEIKTTENHQKIIALVFKPTHTVTMFVQLSCSEPNTNKWTYYIYQCMPRGSYELTGVPAEAEKVWTITRSLTHFTVHCNSVLVLNFNFQSDFLAGFDKCPEIWSRWSNEVSFDYKEEMYEPGYIYIRIRNSCPEPTVYLPDGATPVPTCLNREPEKTATVAGCFCPEGQFLQDELCVEASGCKCLYDGTVHSGGEQWPGENGETCSCSEAGINCVCGDETLVCRWGTEKSTNPQDCKSTCIKYELVSGVGIKLGPGIVTFLLLLLQVLL